MKIIRTGMVPAALLALAVSLSAKTISVTQPTGGEFRAGTSMTIAWTKNFTPIGPGAARLLIKLYHRSGDITSDLGLIEEADVNAGQFVWTKVGRVKTGNVPADSNYTILLIMKSDPSTFARSPEFAIKPTFRPGASTVQLKVIRIYSPAQGMVFLFDKPNPVQWDRSLIAAYDKVHFYVRRPDGSNAAFNQMFATAPNTPYPQSSTDPFCWSGNCALYMMTITQDTLLPSPNDQYYLDMFTPDRKYMGKSKLFYWKKG
jgi:hypothetical protein